MHGADRNAPSFWRLYVFLRTSRYRFAGALSLSQQTRSGRFSHLRLALRPSNGLAGVNDMISLSCRSNLSFFVNLIPILSLHVDLLGQRYEPRKTQGAKQSNAAAISLHRLRKICTRRPQAM